MCCYGFICFGKIMWICKFLSELDEYFEIKNGEFIKCIIYCYNFNF